VRDAILVLALIIVAAKLGGELLGRMGQPPVLGELLIGVLLGNLSLFGITALEPLRENTMLRVVAEIGAILAPPMPAFYHKPQSVDEIVDQSVDRVLDLIGLPSPETKRWNGPERSK